MRVLEHKGDANPRKTNVASIIMENNFKVASYTLVKEDDDMFRHWSEGLKMCIEKDGVSILLEEKEIEELVKTLPKTFGGSY